MVNLGLSCGVDAVKSVKVGFRLPYYTHWGENLLVCGSEPVLGSWDVKKGLLLSPLRDGDELFWRGSVPVPVGFECEYNYYVVDDKKNVLRWETGKRRQLVVADGIKGGETLEFHDLWQTGSDALAFRSAFKDVIFRRSWNLEIQASSRFISTKILQDDAIIVQFKVSCPNLPDNTSVCVVGSSSKLGNWRIKYGHKLSYAGDSIWKTDVAIPKDEFPIKYPFGVESLAD